MAVVDRADSDVVPELGVPLSMSVSWISCGQTSRGITYGPISDGVTDSEGGGGKLIRVGVDILDAVSMNKA